MLVFNPLDSGGYVSSPLHNSFIYRFKDARLWPNSITLEMLLSYYPLASGGCAPGPMLLFIFRQYMALNIYCINYMDYP